MYYARKIETATVTGATGEALYITLPRNLIDSGASMTFVIETKKLTNTSKHVRPVLTEEGKTSFSKHAGKL